MTYFLYTDAAAGNSGSCSSAFVLRTAGKFIHMSAGVYDGNDITEAETAAVGLGVEYLLEHYDLSEDDTVKIMTDSRAVINFFDNFDGKKHPKTNFELSKVTWRIMKELQKKRCKLYFVKIQAHNSELNGNGIADRLAKFALRMKYYSTEEHLQRLKEKEARRNCSI